MANTTDIRITIVGMRYRPDFSWKDFLAAPLCALEFEPDNHVDPNAIKFMYVKKNKWIDAGYVPRTDNQRTEIRELIEGSGGQFVANICRGDAPRCEDEYNAQIISVDTGAIKMMFS